MWLPRLPGGGHNRRVFELEGDGRVVLSVYLQPGGSADVVVGPYADALKLRVQAPPEGGRANEAAARLLAQHLAVPRRAVELVAGAASRHKRFRISGLTTNEVAERLGLRPDG
jgi:uncharacterized protein (TIGR00251 family)